MNIETMLRRVRAMREEITKMADEIEEVNTVCDSPRILEGLSIASRMERLYLDLDEYGGKHPGEEGDRYSTYVASLRELHDGFLGCVAYEYRRDHANFRRREHVDALNLNK